MNPVDLDRLASKTSNGTVVDIAAYRAAADGRKTSAPYVDPFTSQMLLWIVCGLAFLFILARVR